MILGGPDYSRPYMPSLASDAASAVDTLTKFRSYINAQNLDAANQQAGQLYASGDYTGAQQLLAQGGHIDEAEKMRQAVRQVNADKLADLNKTNQVMGNMALAYKNDPDATPEDWARYIAAAKAHGLKTDGYEDPATGPTLAAAQANIEQKVIENEQKRRDGEVLAWRLNDQGQLVGFNQKTGEQTEPVTPTQGVDYTKPPLQMALPKGGAGGSSAIERIATDYQNTWKTQHPDAPELPRDEALNAASIANRNGSGSGISFVPDANGVPRLNTSGNIGTRSYAYTPQGKEELSEASGVGKAKTALAQRVSIAKGALNHLETLEQISDQDLDNTLGVIHSYGGYQKFQDAVNSGRVADSVAYHNAKQTLAVLLRETQNAYHVAGTGADTDQRLKDTQEAFSPDSIMASPNGTVFKQRLANIRAILQGVINQPMPERSNHPTAGQRRATEEGNRVSNAPEVRGQVQRLPHGLTEDPLGLFK